MRLTGLLAFSKINKLLDKQPSRYGTSFSLLSNYYVSVSLCLVMSVKTEMCCYLTVGVLQRSATSRCSWRTPTTASSTVARCSVSATAWTATASPAASTSTLARTPASRRMLHVTGADASLKRWVMFDFGWGDVNVAENQAISFSAISRISARRKFWANNNNNNKKQKKDHQKI